MTGLPKSQGAYRPDRPYRPSAHVHGPFCFDGMEVACAPIVRGAPNEAPTFAHGPQGRQGSTPWPTGNCCRDVGQRGPPVGKRWGGALICNYGKSFMVPSRPLGAKTVAGTVARSLFVCLSGEHRPRNEENETCKSSW